MRPTTSSQITEIAHRWSAHQGQHVAGVRSATRTPGFIKGPLPLNWMLQAAALPGKALHVGLCVWYLAGLTQSKRVRLTSKTTEAMGVSRDAKGEALKRLALAGLVGVDQRPGCAPEVTILDVTPSVQ